MANHKQIVKTIEALANNIKESNFFEPVASQSSFMTLHSVDKDVFKKIDTQHLFFFSPKKAETRQKFSLEQGEKLFSGTFRNSFYPEIWRQFTDVDDLFLKLDFKGVIRLDVFLSTFGTPPKKFLSKLLARATRTSVRLNIAKLQDFLKNSRIFWEIQALSKNSDLYEVSFKTDAEPVSDGRIIVLLRTFKRTDDIVKLLNYLNKDAAKDINYDLFQRLYFIVLDTSPDIESNYQADFWPNLNLSILASANLGGGGNAGHLLWMMQQALVSLDQQPDDILILDDDLIISTESLRRYATFARYRNKEVACSLPVLMKSEPIVVWEDGGYWGRLGPDSNHSLGRRSFFPTLLRHGWRMKEFEHIDEFASLNFCEYATFIFFGLPYKTFLELGYPIPFFLRGDDIEYSLRLQAKGIPLFTNPNLCAWHEPGHSYGQEFMAILHGLIINLNYGELDPTIYANFFYKRAAEHISVFDDAGLIIYTEVLKGLSEGDDILEVGFEEYYLKMLQLFKGLDSSFGRLSPFIINQIQSKIGEIPDKNLSSEERKGTLIVPFLHMGNQDHRNFQSVLLYNSHSGLYKNIDVEDVEQQKRLAKAAGDFYYALGVFIEKFDEVAQKWQKRFVELAKDDDFWQIAHKNIESETKLLTKANRANISLPITEEIEDLSAINIDPEDDSDLEDLFGVSLDVKSGMGLDDDFKDSSSTSFYYGDDKEDEVGSISKSKTSGRSSMLSKKSLSNKPEAGYDSSLDKGSSSSSDYTIASIDLLPEDFDPQRYLELNPDVKTAKVDPIAHYLNHGRKEGRLWQ